MTKVSMCGLLIQLGSLINNAQGLLTITPFSHCGMRYADKCNAQAITKPLQFTKFPVILAKCTDRIKFVMRPIRLRNQVHGVYLATGSPASANTPCPPAVRAPGKACNITDPECEGWQLLAALMEVCDLCSCCIMPRLQ
jgi:hypothetical protein